MRWLSDVWFRIRALLGRGQMERDLDEEFAFHLEMEARKYQAQGMTRAEAARLARVKFGGVERQKEHARESWGVSVLRDLGGDFRYANRQMLKNPAFAALAALTLALGIGGTVALGSVAHGLLIRPLPVHDEDRLVTFWSDYNWRGVEFDYVRERAQAYQGLAAWSNQSYTLRTADGSSWISATVASAELFDVLGVRPLLGRTFLEGDDRPGAEPVIVLSHGLWQQEFGADPGIVGQRVSLDGEPTTVVGVMPDGFYFPAPAMRAWTPLNLDPDDRGYQGNGWLVLTGRLAPGVSESQLQDDLASLAAQLGERFTYPEAWDKTRNPFVTPLREYLLGDVRPAVLLLLGSVGVLLLMACANVAALLLSRASDRTGEMSVRVALGAGRARLARQVLTESVVLGLVGGTLGLALAVALFDLLVTSLPIGEGFAETLSLDWITLASALVLSVATGAVISLAPIRSVLLGQATAVGLGERRQSGTGAAAAHTQGLLVMAEVLLAVVLVTGAALLVRSVEQLRSLDSGLDPEGVLAVDLYIGAQESSTEERVAFFRQVVERAEALPGVEGAGLVNRLPIRDGGYQGTIDIEDRPDLAGPSRPNSAYRVITPGTFAALDVELIEGRGLEPGDQEGSVPVAVVNETFARTMWPGESALGRRIGATVAGGMFEIVGVIRNVAVHDLVSEAPMAAYYAWHQVLPGADHGVLVLETRTDPTSLASAVRRIVSDTDSRGVVGTVQTMEQVVDAGMSENLRLRFFLMLFSALGLVLGSVGVYGVVSYAVDRRRAEFGIRMALGARPRRLLADVVRVGMIPVVAGTLAGLGVSLGVARLLAAFLFEVPPTDPVSFTVAAGILLGAGVIAALVPAVRASRTDPAVALRAE
jgi:predicted permease